MSPVDRFFNVLMWIIVGAIVFTVLVRGGKTSLGLSQVFGSTFLGSLGLITGQETKYS